jgi:RTC4-like domain
MFCVMQALFPDVTNHGLSFVNFTRRILLPEAAVLLAQDDLQISREKAIEILRTSRHYGMTMHPEDDSKDGEEYFVEVQKTRKRPEVKVKVEDVGAGEFMLRTVMEGNREIILLE